MVTICRNRIRNIVVHLIKGCDIEIQTPYLPRAPFSRVPRLISFGVRDIGNLKKIVPVSYYTTEKDTKLIINTRLDGKIKPFRYTPTTFWIKIPEGCHLGFEYFDPPIME